MAASRHGTSQWVSPRTCRTTPTCPRGTATAGRRTARPWPLNPPPISSRPPAPTARSTRWRSAAAPRRNSPTTRPWIPPRATLPMEGTWPGAPSAVLASSPTSSNCGSWTGPPARWCAPPRPSIRASATTSGREGTWSASANARAMRTSSAGTATLSSASARTCTSRASR